MSGKLDSCLQVLQKYNAPTFYVEFVLVSYRVPSVICFTTEIKFI